MIFRAPIRYLSQALLISLWLGVSAENATAQGAEADEKAEVYYDQGVRAFFAKQYSKAIVHFQRAHALDPSPIVLFNISIAHSRLGNAREALVASQSAEEMGGLPDDTALKNRARIRGYERIMRAQALAETSVGVATLPPVVPQRGMDTLGWVGVGTASAGAAVLVGAGVLSYLLVDDIDAYEDARNRGDLARSRELYDAVQTRQSLGQIMLYSGAGLVALGGALWAVDIVENRETKSAKASSQPSLSGGISAGGARVQATWRFE